MRKLSDVLSTDSDRAAPDIRVDRLVMVRTGAAYDDDGVTTRKGTSDGMSEHIVSHKDQGRSRPR
jgi:hypothetical protein